MKKLILFAVTPGVLIAQVAQMHAAGADVRLAATFHESSLRLLVTGDVRPGATYVIETTSSLGADAPWLVVEPVPAVSNAILYELPAPSDQTAFFRVRLPRPALFRVEPAVSPAAGGTTLYIIGQMLGTNGQVRIGGQTVPVEAVQQGSIYRCVAPALPEGTYDVEWIEEGRVVADWKRNLTVTELLSARQRLMEPPAEPPASPEWSRTGRLYEPGTPRFGNARYKTRTKSNSTDERATFDSLDLFIDCNVDSRTDEYIWEGLRLLPATGELQLQECDVVVPGVGLDFAFVRTYRSRTGRTTPMGHNWDHSYNLYIEAEGDDVAVCDGTGRRDVLYRQPDGTYSRDEFFWQGRWDDATGNFILQFPGKGVWEFYHFNVRPAGGRIARIADANGNALQFTYDPQGRLTEVVDTLGRTFTFEYTPDGFIRSLRDFTGRRWIYTYHSGHSPGGGPGDLASVTTPSVTGTPTGNDFPSGKTTRYTYTTGAADDRLNHNLLTITDAKGQTWLQVTYHTNTSPFEMDFDAVASVQRGIEKKDIRRGMVIASPANRYAVVRAIVRDGVGNVTEYYYDSLNRPVIIRKFTGRSNVQEPVTDVANRPTGKLRAEDPDYYETGFEWNNDSLLTRYLWPDGDEIRCVYERDFNPAANPRKKGDLRIWRFQPLVASDMDADGIADDHTRVWRFEHDPRFGSLIRRVRAEMYCEDIRFSYSPAAVFKAGGALVKPRNAVLFEAYTRFKRGGALADPRNAVLCSAKSKPLHGGDDSFPFTGLAFDLDNGMRHGSVLRNVEGIDGEIMIIECAYSRVTDPRGIVTTAIYDERGNRTQVRCADPVSGVTQLDCEYDARGRLIRCVQPADAEGRRRQDSFSYHATGPMAGYLASVVRDVGGLNLTTSFEYDARGNLTRIVNPRGHDVLWTYNALDQVVQVQSPPAGGGQRVTTRFFYDANDNLVQVDHENRDANGVLDGSNPWWSSFVQFDALDRPILLAHEVAHVVQQGTVFLTNRLSWDANDNLIRIEGPRAVSGQDPHQQSVFAYDERGLLFTSVEAPGTGLSATNRWDYDAKGDLRRFSRSYAGTIKPTSVEPRFRQPVRVTDAAGNLTLFSYDRAGNLVRIRHLGETNDVPGSAGNRRLAETRLDYDALGRLVRWRDSFFDISTQSPIGDGESTHTFAYAPNGQLILATDDLGRTTRYTYDTAGRCVAITDPASNRVEFSYDANGNVTLIRQVNRSDLGGPEQVFLLTLTYDACDRLLSVTDNVGNTERYAYDSRGNVVRVTDPRGNDTCYEYDGLDRLVTVRYYAGPCGGTPVSASRWHFQDTRLVAFTDGNSNITRYAYDSLDRCIAVTNADFTVSQMAYDAFGNLAQIRDPNGTLVTCTYDALDRCVRRDITPGPGVADTTTFEAFAYDGLSRVVLATNNASMIEFDYFGVGVKHTEIEAREKARQDCVAQRVTRDTVGNIKSLELPSGRVLTATHDALNRISTLNLVEGGR
ncbi:MAG: DUF6531 domain-containing protein, partial [Verrucomicrobiota bacterium]|nr:DUF6531 domain-containing protein [Verrucomicrobiota bacterium]